MERILPPPPLNVQHCIRCTLSNQRPRLVLDREGVCSACRYWDEKKNVIDWADRERKLLALLESHRSGNNDFDVIVPCSGGKDGSYVAHALKHQYGMNPLLVTWAPLLPTEIGKQNLENLINAGFPHIKGTLPSSISGALARYAMREVGYPFMPFVYGQFNFPLQIAVKWRIPLVFYGENGEVEYGGDMRHAESPVRQLTMDSRILFSGTSPEVWAARGMNASDLELMSAPSARQLEEVGVEAHWFGYYKAWDPQDNFYYAVEHTGFTPNPERSEGTYSKYASLDDKVDGFHYYFAWLKFGHGRATYDTAQEIRAGKITRDEGISLINRYDGEFPERHFDDFLEFLDISEGEFWEVVDSWRPPHLWQRDGKNTWKLTSPIRG